MSHASPSILLPSTLLRVFDRAMSPSTMPFGPELTAEGLRTLSPSTVFGTVS